MAKPSICVVALIASIVSMAGSTDIHDLLEHATNEELAKFMPGYTVDADGILVPEVSHPEVGGAAESFPSSEDLPPLDPFDSEDYLDLQNILNAADFLEGL